MNDRTPDAHHRFNQIIAQSGVEWDYSGTCVACMHLTSTALGFRGNRGWLITCLAVLGVPEQEAIDTFDLALEQGIVDPVADPLMEAHPMYNPADPLYEWVLRLCLQCHARCPVEMPQPVLQQPGRPNRIPCHRGLLPNTTTTNDATTEGTTP